jgi:hypothetical protein
MRTNKELQVKLKRKAPQGHMMEGVVIVPERERRDENIGRVALKHISNRYWEGAD